MSSIIEEEVLTDTQPTDENTYDAEYDKAWGEEKVEQPSDEVKSDVDVPDETESSEDSITTEEGVKDTEESKEVPSEDFAEVLKWKGKELPVTREELIALAQKGFDSEKKWQEAAINRPIKELLDKYGFNAEQLEMFGNITKDKNAEALALLAQQSGIDIYDAEHKTYKPVVKATNYELDDVINEINENEEIATQMNDYVSSVPKSTKDLLVSKPEILRAINIDMQQGIAQKIMPEVIKQLVINSNQDFVSLYQQIGRKIFSQPEPTVEAVVKTEQPRSTREDKLKIAVSKKTAVPDKKIADDYDAAWDDNTHFEAVKRRLSGF